MPLDPMARAKIKEAESRSVDAATKMPMDRPSGDMTGKELAEQLAATREAAAPKAATPSSTPPKQEQPKEESEYYTDIDVDKFFITGKIEYSTTIYGSIDLRMRILSGDELNATQLSMFKKQDMSVNVAYNENAAEILGYALLSYGPRDLEKMEYSERVDFIKSLPSPVIAKLGGVYAKFESSAIKLLNDKEALKN